MLKKIMAKANARKKNGQKGFTLIELLAVIVILAILAAIAIPSVISIVNHQNDKAAVQDALTAIHAAKLYVADHSSASLGDRATFSESQLNQYLDNSVDNRLPSKFTVVYTNNSGVVTYTIDDSNLTSISGLRNNGVSGHYNETTLINFNK